MKMTDISESCSVRLNLQENRIYRESVIDTIISFMNIIWGSFIDICIHESEEWKYFSLHVTITLFISYDNPISFIVHNRISLKVKDISRYMLPLKV